MIEQTSSTETRKGYCPHCGRDSPITDLVSQEVGKQLDAQVQRINSQLDLGEVEDREKSKVKFLSTLMYYSLGAGVLKAIGLFGLANLFAPEGTRVYANIYAGLITLGNAFARFSQFTENDYSDTLHYDIKDRLRAYPPKK